MAKNAGVGSPDRPKSESTNGQQSLASAHRRGFVRLKE